MGQIVGRMLRAQNIPFTALEHSAEQVSLSRRFGSTIYFGDPSKPEEWSYIQAFSPYHNLKAGVKYPSVLFTTSTRDDRVHPGHARKMMAKMMEMGADVRYFENIEGGHGGAADNAQRAHMAALDYTFLWQKLK